MGSHWGGRYVNISRLIIIHTTTTDDLYPWLTNAELFLTYITTHQCHYSPMLPPPSLPTTCHFNRHRRETSRVRRHCGVQTRRILRRRSDGIQQQQHRWVLHHEMFAILPTQALAVCQQLALESHSGPRPDRHFVGKLRHVFEREIDSTVFNVVGHVCAVGV